MLDRIAEDADEKHQALPRSLCAVQCSFADGVAPSER